MQQLVSILWDPEVTKSGAIRVESAWNPRQVCYEKGLRGFDADSQGFARIRQITRIRRGFDADSMRIRIRVESA